MLEKIGPTTKSTFSRSSRPLALVTAPSGLSSSSTTTTSTSLPAILPPRSLIPSCRPSRDCWPSTAAGPDKVVITPILIFSCAAAGAVAIPSKTASPVSFNDCFMNVPPFGLYSRKPLPQQMPGLQLILTVTAPASRTPLCKPCANYLKPKEIWAMIESCAPFGSPNAQAGQDLHHDP